MRYEALRTFNLMVTFSLVTPFFPLSTMYLKAAEALGAIALESNIPLLKKSLISDPAQEVRETCELALSRIEELRNRGSVEQHSTDASPFLSVDPAAPASCSSVQELRFAFRQYDKMLAFL